MEKLDLTMSNKEIEDRILNETDLDKLDNIIDLFNLNIRRKDILRSGRLNDLQDKITEQISERVSKNADQFSNKDLLDYFKTIQETINKSNNDLSDIDKPAIQLNQVNINVEDANTLNSDSRKRVIDAVNAVLRGADTPKEIEEVEVIEDIDE